MRVETHTKPLAMLRKFGAAAIFAASSLAYANTAAAAGGYGGQGYYFANCGTFYNDCMSAAQEGPVARRVAGLITSAEAYAEISVNQSACMSAMSSCQSSPASSPQSPSGFVFTFRAIFPY
ncbi:hypothetical protein [Asticcacaulis sp.]|uniref:hypothetical protein n=1 Tax=Asticcacaulis sp. TaxID=1872648 RepID=UPI002B898416|nr:hypothetical protein [Asticcacaulis sp.]HTM79758.1 hypothetical protein [Asticcacaulis sp.]